MKTTFLPIRALLAAAALIAMAAFAAPEASAQTACTCTNLYLKIDPSIACQFKVCIKDFSGFNCVGITGGGLFPVPCNNTFGAYLIDCNGNYVLINDANNGNAVSCVCLQPGCCVDAFLAFDVNGCPVIKIEPASATCVC